MQDYDNMTFQQALVELELTEADYKPVEQHNQDDPPPIAWQARAQDFVRRATSYLWHPNSIDGQNALGYLRARGFTDETIKAAGLGYCPLQKDGSWYIDALEYWGLTVSQTKKDVVRIADGIIIPWFFHEEIWKICIKRPWAREGELRYGQVVGSAEGLYNASSISPGQPVMIVEGEFDCLSIQEGPYIAVVATGSASRGRSQRWIDRLSQASTVFQSFDSDQAGDDGAAFWLDRLKNAIRWKPWGKDPNEMLLQGSSIKIWLETAIAIATAPQAPPVSTPIAIEAVEQPDDQAAINAVQWLGKPCPTRYETSTGKDHGVHKTDYIDLTGYQWCSRCNLQPGLMNVGVERSFPSFFFEWHGRTIFVEDGRENWFRFACEAGYSQVSVALEVLEK